MLPLEVTASADGVKFVNLTGIEIVFVPYEAPLKVTIPCARTLWSDREEFGSRHPYFHRLVVTADLSGLYLLDDNAWVIVPLETLHLINFPRVISPDPNHSMREMIETEGEAGFVKQKRRWTVGRFITK